MKTQEKYSSYFLLRRFFKNNLIILGDDCPSALRDLIGLIHNDFDSLRSDWIYSEIFDAFEALEIDDYDSLNIESDAYHTDVKKWFYENSFADAICDEAINEMGLLDTDTPHMLTDTPHMLFLMRNGQAYARRRIISRVNEFLKDNMKGENS